MQLNQIQHNLQLHLHICVIIICNIMRNKNTINIFSCVTCHRKRQRLNSSRVWVWVWRRLFFCWPHSKAQQTGARTTTLVGIIKAAFHGHYFLVTAVSMLFRDLVDQKRNFCLPFWGWECYARRRCHCHCRSRHHNDGVCVI